MEIKLNKTFKGFAGAQALAQYHHKLRISSKDWNVILAQPRLIVKPIYHGTTISYKVVGEVLKELETEKDIYIPSVFIDEINGEKIL